MGYLIGSILLSVLGVFLGSSSYGLNNDTLGYVLGTAASVSFLVGFLLLEYALYHHDSSNVFAPWGAGLAAILALSGIFLWGEALSMAKMGFISITLLGTLGLIITGSRSQGESLGG